MFTITDKAIAELKNILTGPEMPAQPAIKVYAQSGGCCSTHHLGIEVADLAAEGLTAEDFDGLKVVLEEDARPIAQNATIDYYDHPENAGFKVLWQKNVNEEGCGCH
jgi:Fe-S cluster assembly iron-binding protein IscA